MMLQSYLRPHFSPQVDLEDFGAWRERILSTVLFVAMVLGALVAVPSVVLALFEGLWPLALCDVIAAVWVVTVGLKRSLSVRARAWNLCALLYLLGLVLLVTVGAVSQIYLMAFPVMAALFLGLRPAVFALILNGVTLPAIGFLANADLQLVGFAVQPLVKWIVISANFTFVSSMLTLSIVVLLSGLEKALTRKQESEERYRTLIEWTPEPLAVHVGQRFVYVNPAAIELFGAKSAQDLVGMPIFDLIHPDSKEVARVRLNIHKQRACTLPPNEQKFLRLDGSTFHAEVQSTPIVFDRAAAIQIAIHDITERKAAADQIESLAFSDPLTGLPNRRLLMDRIEQSMAAAVRHGHQVALLFIDLDNFKMINDTVGHDKGDLLLKQVAHRLTVCVRHCDTVARLSGDEFVVLLEDLDNNPQQAATQAHVVAAKILSGMDQPYQLDGHPRHSSASIGVALYGGAQRETIEKPLKRAELAMYQAKATGRNALCFFESEMETVVTTRAILEADLRDAVHKGQFILYYQAQVDRAGQLIGVEALVRWQHPRRGLVSPAEFIPIAETSGLILPMGQWVMDEACKQLTLWSLRPEMAHLTMAVNVSALQFIHKDFVEQVLATLVQTVPTMLVAYKQI